MAQTFALRPDKGSVSVNEGRKRSILGAYTKVADMGSLFDDMMTNRSAAGRLLMRYLWRLPKPRYEAYLARAFAGIPEGFHGHLLEVPVGTGALSLPRFQDFPQAEITCLDYVAGMLERARNYAAELGLQNVRFQQGDVGQLPFAAGSFEIVLSVNGFHAFPDKDAAFREIARVLKWGGTLTGSCYVRGESRVVDAFCKAFLVPTGCFTPPFDTEETLRARLEALYREVEVETFGAFAAFRCRK